MIDNRGEVERLVSNDEHARLRDIEKAPQILKSRIPVAPETPIVLTGTLTDGVYIVGVDASLGNVFEVTSTNDESEAVIDLIISNPAKYQKLVVVVIANDLGNLVNVNGSIIATVDATVATQVEMIYTGSFWVFYNSTRLVGV